MALSMLVVALTVAASDHCLDEYNKFLDQYGQQYSQMRFQMFCKTLESVENHNTGNSRFTMGINQFSDWTDGERAAVCGAVLSNESATSSPDDAVAPARGQVNFTASTDWRARMPPVKNQGQCGSCWAFSAMAVVDFFGGSHSEQQLVDCSGQGCGGGSPSHGLQYLANNGVACATEDEYPYQGKDGSCKGPSGAVTKISTVQVGWTYNDIMKWVQSQVVAVTISLSSSSPFFKYSSGVFDQDCGSGEGHAIAAVGYSGDYWIIRNSWGSGWGQKGYIFFKKGQNLCGIENYAVIAKASSPTPPPTLMNVVNTASGKCLSITGDDNMNKAELFDCANAPATIWKFKDGQIVNSDGKCLDIFGDHKSDGSDVGIYSCWGGANQKWEQKNGNLVNPATGKCLDIAGDHKSDHSVIDIWGCWGGANQKWDLQTPSSKLVNIVNPNSGKCVHITEDKDGAHAELLTCENSAAFQWKLKAGQLINSGGRCLDIGGDHKSDKSPVGLWSCWGGDNQKWEHTNGNVVNPASGKCLDVYLGSKDDHAKLELYACGSKSANQIWEFKTSHDVTASLDDPLVI